MTPNQIRIILALEKNKELPYEALSKATGLSKATLVKEVKAFEGTLEKAGYVRATEFDDPSGETWYFSLTRKGEDLAKRILAQRSLLSKRK